MKTQFTLHDAVFSAGAARPLSVAVEHDGGAMTYQELEGRSAALANALLLMASPGDRVAVMLGNTASFFIAVLAISRAGLICVPMPPRLTVRELVHLLDDSGAAIAITTETSLELLGSELEARARAGALKTIVWEQAFHDCPSGLSLSEQGGVAFRGPEVYETGPFFIGYTSGTTGAPKGTLVSHRARTTLSLTAGQEYGCYYAGSRNLIATPLYHGAGMNRGFTPLTVGGTVVLHPRFDVERVDEVVSSGDVQSVFMVPTMFDSIKEVAGAKTSEVPITIMSSAAALPENLKEFTLSHWPRARLFEIYGSTEGGTISTLRPEDVSRKSRCVGQPLAFTEVRIADEAGNVVAPGEVGDLWSRSPYMFEGYWNQPEATRNVVSEDGFVTCRDLARIDDEGYVYIVGRRTEMIITGGINVFPREVEEVLRDHPLIIDVSVVGLPDDRWGERVHAAVIVARGVDVSETELVSHCRAQLSPQKIPKSFHFLQDFPRTSTGKVVRSELIQAIQSESAPSA